MSATRNDGDPARVTPGPACDDLTSELVDLSGLPLEVVAALPAARLGSAMRHVREVTDRPMDVLCVMTWQSTS